MNPIVRALTYRTSSSADDAPSAEVRSWQGSDGLHVSQLGAVLCPFLSSSTTHHGFVHFLGRCTNSISESRVVSSYEVMTCYGL